MNHLAPRTVVMTCRFPTQPSSLALGLGAAAVEFSAVVLPERLRIDAEDAIDIAFRDTVGRKPFNLTPACSSGRCARRPMLSDTPASA
jgi:hypothetical protein